jgi:DNA-binding beta-propeller fold protein YncE
MDEHLLESRRVSDKEQHPIPASEGGHVIEAPVQQDRDSHRAGQAGPDVDVACGGDQPCRGEAGDGATVEAPPPRRPRFRDRPGHWWLLAAAGRYEPAQVAAPPRQLTPDATPQDTGATPREPTAGGDAVAAAPRRSRARVLRGLIAAALALILLGLSIDRLRAPEAPPGAPAPAPTAVPFAPLRGPSMLATAVLGTPARLVQPHEAVLLPHGQIAVADTGNGRLAILDATGHLLKSVRTGALQEPYAVVASSHALFVLDAGRGSIERYDLTGRFEREIISNPPLLANARGMALGPDGTLYVANPRSNSVVLLSTGGHILRQVTSPLGTGPDQFNQPSDVAVSPNNTVYVLDNMNNRIKVLTATGAFIAQWPAPPSETLHSVHVLPLRGGRMLASDPFAGALLLYRPGGGLPVRVPLGVPGRAAGSVQPLGLSLGPGGDILVTDANGNRVLLVSSSDLLRKATGA